MNRSNGVRARRRRRRPSLRSAAAVGAVLVTVSGGASAVALTRSDPAPASADKPESSTASGATAIPASPRAAVERPAVSPDRRAELARRAQRTAARQEAARQEAERKAARASKAASREAQPVSFELGSLNVLGSQHTGPRGDDHRGWPSASVRTPRQADVIRARGVDVVGLQEAQPDQLNGLVAATGFKAFPGFAFGAQDTDNSILYDPARFEYVSGTSFTIHFMHADRPQTVLKLRDKRTGREMYFVNCHTSAGHDRRNTATRYAGMARIASYVADLRDQGYPVFVTGDMNDRQQFRTRVLGPARLTAAIDGPWTQRTFGSGWMAVDWVASTTDVSWSDFAVDVLQARKTSDHYFVSASARVPGAS